MTDTTGAALTLPQYSNWAGTTALVGTNSVTLTAAAVSAATATVSGAATPLAGVITIASGNTLTLTSNLFVSVGGALRFEGAGTLALGAFTLDATGATLSLGDAAGVNVLAVTGTGSVVGGSTGTLQLRSVSISPALILNFQAISTFVFVRCPLHCCSTLLHPSLMVCLLWHALMCVCVCGAGGPASGATVTLNVPSASSLSIAGWTGSIVVTGAARLTLTVSGTATGSLSVQTGATLTIAGGTVSSALTLSPTISSQTVVVAAGATLSSTTVTVQAASELNVAGYVFARCLFYAANHHLACVGH